MKTQAGRPRDPSIDDAVLRATAELLIEVGYSDLSLAAIAESAGTTRPTLYRRWPTKAHLVYEAAFPVDASTTIADTDSLADDIHAMVTAVRDLFCSPVAHAALPGLLAELAADPSLHAALLDRFAVTGFAAMRRRLAQASEAGQAHQSVDPDVLIEALSGSVLMALLIRGGTLDDTWVNSATNLLLKGIAT